MQSVRLATRNRFLPYNCTNSLEYMPDVITCTCTPFRDQRNKFNGGSFASIALTKGLLQATYLRLNCESTVERMPEVSRHHVVHVAYNLMKQVQDQRFWYLKPVVLIPQRRNDFTQIYLKKNSLGLWSPIIYAIKTVTNKVCETSN